MCGIAGFIRTLEPSAGQQKLLDMGGVIAHRGPDAHGEFMDDYVGLSHRRLSVIDLSVDGNQPMVSHDGRFVIVFNGEIYNFIELRATLIAEGHQFKTRTDTEVVLTLFQLQGITCLEKLNGMFAIAIWDKQERKLFLTRDRIGKKPLYFFHREHDRLAFGSEIKCLLELDCVPRIIEPTAISDYLKYLYVPAPKTIFKDIYKLLPGHYLELPIGSIPLIRQYWDVDFSRQATATFEEKTEELLALVGQCTASRMTSDVPLGAFLSGGIDSSAIVGLMAQVSPKAVKTCSIGFLSKKHDETPYAREVAKLFDTEHKEYFVKEGLADTVTLLSRYFDEPFADSSAVPTYHVSRLARQDVTVALAGDGGDECFGGYEKYVTTIYENRVRRLVPRPLLAASAAFTRRQSGILMRKATSLTNSALSDPARAYYRTNSFIDDFELDLVLADSLKKQLIGYDPFEHTRQYWDHLDGADHVSRMLYVDLKTYLPGDILVKVDRMSMAHSLEVRAPLLDYRVIEFAATLPSQWKIKGTNKKFILKNCFSHMLPAEILKRKKQGFTVPLGAWFRKELRQLASECLFDEEIMGEYFSLSGVRRIWDEHQSGVRNHETVLWSLLMFSLWHQEYMA